MARSITQEVARRRREAAALRLRQEGHTFDEIAGKLGFANRGAAYKAVQRALLDVVRQPAEELRRMEMERLEEMLQVLWPVATDSQNPKHLRAIEKVLSVMEHMERLAGLTAKPALRPRRGPDDVPPGAVLVIQQNG